MVTTTNLDYDQKDYVKKPGGDQWHEPLLQFFMSAPLPQRLRDVSTPFYNIAHHVVQTLPRNPERTVCLRKLLEAKDCAVRTALYGMG